MVLFFHISPSSLATCGQNCQADWHPSTVCFDARMRVLASTQPSEKAEVGSYHYGMINIQVLIHASWALPVIFAHTLQSVQANPYVHTHTHTDKGAGGIVWIFHTHGFGRSSGRWGGMWFLSIRPYNYFHNIWYQSNVEKRINVILVGKCNTE